MSAPGRPSTPRLSGRGLSLAVPGRTLCSGLDFHVQPGECWAIVGPNGAGKTTLLATLAGLTAPVAGEIAYDGVPLRTLAPRERARRRGWLPQDSVDYFPATVLETVLVGRHPHLARWQWETAADVDRAKRALADVGLAGFDARQVGSLSGGERRRVALAAVLAQDPDLILLDEPSSHLDLVHQIAALDVLARLAHERGKAIVMVLHDLHLALRYADHAVALGGGRATAGPAGAILTADALSALFGHPLLALGDGSSRTFVPA
jgi:iron complex transport system ATP-binding protein